MGATTGIQWTDATFNPWWGCTKVSPGCDNCYAENLAHRFGTEWGAGKTRRTFGDKHWREPLAWNAKAERDGRRIKVFCASMADVFDNDAPEGERERLFALIEATPWIDWQLLTKRIGNVRHMIPDRWSVRLPQNVWLGATIVNQAEADRDIVKLLSIKVGVRFLSIEPMLGPIDLVRVYGEPHSKPFIVIDNKTPQGYVRCVSHAPGYCMSDCSGRLAALSWIICGGESGKKARPMQGAWARSLRDQCAAAGVPFFFKQWGEWAERIPATGGEPYLRMVGKHDAGRWLDGVEHNEFPQTEQP